MEQRLQELKEKITSFVKDYNVDEFIVDISEMEVRTVGGKCFKTNKKVNLEIRV